MSRDKPEATRGLSAAPSSPGDSDPASGPAPYPPSPSFVAPSHLVQDLDHVKLPLTREAQLQPGAQVDQYVIEAKVDEGGMGTVYRARQPLIGKCVAIKVIKPMYAVDPLAVDRFIREARAVNEIRHRNIIDIFAFGHLPIGLPYFVMEYLEGHTLQEEVARRAAPFPLSDVVTYLRPVFSALEATHDAGIIHRDVKPENIFIAQQPGGEHIIKLLDFGLVKLAGNVASATHRTSLGMPMGTPDYMAPEQCTGSAVDHRADIYSLGIIVYVLLTGRLPFEADSSIEVFEQHRSTEPPPMSLFAVVPRAVEDVVRWALKKDPNERPQSVRAFREAIEEAALAAPAMAAAAAPATPPPRRDWTGEAEPLESEDAPLDELTSLSAPVTHRVTDMAASEITRPGRIGGVLWATFLIVGIVGLVLVTLLWPDSPETPRPVAAPAPVVEPEGPVAKPAPATGTLRLEVEPEGVALTVDGVPVAAGTDLVLPLGDHVLRATKPGYQQHEERLVLVEGEKLVHPVKLIADAPEKETSASEPAAKSRRKKKPAHEWRDPDDTARPSWAGE